MKRIEGGVTAAIGFQAAGGSAGIKKENVKDMALIYSIVPCVAAGTFTTNLVKAAPVKWDQEIVYDGDTAQAIVCNSGVANACTGKKGYTYCHETAKVAAEELHIPEGSVLVASTGVIGKQLPIEKIQEGVRKLVPLLSNSREAAREAAQAPARRKRMACGSIWTAFSFSSTRLPPKRRGSRSQNLSICSCNAQRSAVLWSTAQRPGRLSRQTILFSS